MDRLLLASASPRRRELLDKAQIPFEAITTDVDESVRDSLDPSERVLALAEDKARAALSLIDASRAPRWILGADTLVCVPDADLGELALGKPMDQDDGRRMLRLLSGKAHFVRTGLALLDRATGKLASIRSDSAVTFAAMTDGEIDRYLEMGEWRGAAGGYRVQGLAAFYIERLEGSWSGVVGLPLRELYVILRQAGFSCPRIAEH